MKSQPQLIEFLQAEMSLSTDAITLGLRQCETAPNVLPIVLWQYGFVTIHQLSQIYDWLERAID